MTMQQAEQQTMGFDHAQVGGELSRHWKLPAMLEECIAFHHDIQAASRYPRETAMVHIANILALMAEVQTLEPADVAPLDPAAWAVTGLSAADVVKRTVHETQAEIAEYEQLFFGKN
jgi:HD-like signal output (HDOD) protein